MAGPTLRQSAGTTSTDRRARFAERGAGGERTGGAHPDRVTVRLRLRERIHRDDTAGPGALLDDERLAEQLLQLGLHQPRDDVGAAARRMREDETDRSVGKCAPRRRAG